MKKAALHLPAHLPAQSYPHRVTTIRGSEGLSMGRPEITFAPIPARSDRRLAATWNDLLDAVEAAS